MSIQPGDIVVLKTGGAQMVVEKVDPKTKGVTCVWHHREGKKDIPMRETYQEVVLELYEDEVPPEPSFG